eukprot:2242196-Alexandrium_andersonii.AAC.1
MRSPARPTTSLLGRWLAAALSGRRQASLGVPSSTSPPGGATFSRRMTPTRGLRRCAWARAARSGRRPPAGVSEWRCCLLYTSPSPRD